MEDRAMDMPQTRITTRDEFAGALRYVLQQAAEDGTRELWLVDPDFESWPLDDPGLLDDLTAWARLPRRHAVMLAHSFDRLPLHRPRFAVWRRLWSHALECRALDEIDVSEVPTLLLAGGGLGVQLLDRRYCRGRWFRDDTTWRTWREVIDALTQRSETSFGPTTLGL
jgi:hypothetical protein